MKELGRQDLEDLANGACILASGGGGSIDMAKGMIAAIGGKPVLLYDLDEVADDAQVVVSAGAGSPVAAAGSSERLVVAAKEAADAAEKALGVRFSHTVAIEVGVGNTLFPMTTAVRKGIGVLDGAGARRAVPSLTMCTFNDVPIQPMELVSVDHKHVTVLVPDAASAEQPMMAIASTDEFSNQAGISFWPMDGRTAREQTGGGHVTYALELGRTLRASKSADPVEAVRRYLDGYLLCEGVLTDFTQQTSGSFDFLTVTIEGKEGATMRLVAQNETLIAWDSRRPYPVAMGPDLICYLGKDGGVFTNADLSSWKGKEIAVIGARAQDSLRKPEIVRSFLEALSALGYGGPYVKIEELQKMDAMMEALPSPVAAESAAVAAAPHQPPNRWWRSTSASGETNK